MPTGVSRVPTSPTLRERGRVASLSRSREADDPELLDARRSLAVAKLQAFIERELKNAPPLTDRQREDIAAMFAGGAQ